MMNGSILTQFFGGGGSAQQRQQRVRVVSDSIRDLTQTLNRIESQINKNGFDPTSAEVIKRAILEVKPTLVEISEKLDETIEITRDLAGGRMAQVAFGGGAQRLLTGLATQVDQLNAILKRWLKRVGGENGAK